MITDDQLRRIMPRLPAARRAQLLPFINGAMQEFGITTPVREAAFLAQVAHETEQLIFMHELWGPTNAQRGYEGRADLGNTQPGDGQRFLGRGALQLTGRANYQHYGSALGVDLVNHPELAALPEQAFRIAGEFWAEHDCNALADNHDFAGITRRINGGFNGMPDRQRYFDQAQAVLGVDAGNGSGGGAAGGVGAGSARSGGAGGGAGARGDGGVGVGAGVRGGEGTVVGIGSGADAGVGASAGAEGSTGSTGGPGSGAGSGGDSPDRTEIIFIRGMDFSGPRGSEGGGGAIVIGSGGAAGSHESAGSGEGGSSGQSAGPGAGSSGGDGREGDGNNGGDGDGGDGGDGD